MRARPERQFYFRLAGHLGMTVRELLARIDSRELSEWVAYERISGPLGGRRLDVAAAIGAAATTNANRRRRKPYDPVDFLPQWDKPARQQQSPEQMWALVCGLNHHLGGEDLRA